ncbi:MAG: hypothetical protein WBN94_02175 [Methanothrix sp.]
MRYEDSCEVYNTGIPLDNTDPIVELAHAKAEIAESINQLRKDRWGFVCLQLDNNENAVLKVTNKIGFQISEESEADLMNDLADYNKKFNLLNPLFVEIQSKFNRIPSPNRNGLGHLRAECIGKIEKYRSRIKSELSYRTGLQSKGQNLDEILANPQFKKFKEEYEQYIRDEEAKLNQLNYYVAEINKIVGGE